MCHEARQSHTLARFFRHSVQALGVTTPSPLLLLDSWPEPEVEAGVAAEGAAGVEAGTGAAEEAAAEADDAPTEEAAPAPGWACDWPPDASSISAVLARFTLTEGGLEASPQSKRDLQSFVCELS